MRWLVVAMLCVGSGSGSACPRGRITPTLSVGGETVRPVAFRSIKQVPSNPRFYLSFFPYGDQTLPTFRRPDGSSVPFTVQPTPFQRVVALTVQIHDGELWIDTGNPTLQQVLVDAHRSLTRSTELEVLGDYVRLTIDSDATLFRIESGDEVAYSMLDDLVVDSESTVIALHGDDTEEVLYRGTPSTEIPWWVVGLALTGLGSVLLARRVSFVG